MTTKIPSARLIDIVHPCPRRSACTPRAIRDCPRPAKSMSEGHRFITQIHMAARSIGPRILRPAPSWATSNARSSAASGNGIIPKLAFAALRGGCNPPFGKALRPVGCTHPTGLGRCPGNHYFLDVRSGAAGTSESFLPPLVRDVLLAGRVITAGWSARRIARSSDFCVGRQI